MKIVKRGAYYVVEGAVEDLDGMDLVLEVRKGKVVNKSPSEQFRKVLFMAYNNSALLQELFKSFEAYYLSEYQILIHEHITIANDLRGNRDVVFWQDYFRKRAGEPNGAYDTVVQRRAEGRCCPCDGHGLQP